MGMLVKCVSYYNCTAELKYTVHNVSIHIVGNMSAMAM
jgi:hypothetical protein